MMKLDGKTLGGALMKRSARSIMALLQMSGLSGRSNP